MSLKPKTVIESKEPRHRLSFLKKHLKTPNISHFKIKQNFTCKGWNECSTSFDLKSIEDSGLNITFSPTKYETLSKRYDFKTTSSKKNTLFMEISNITSNFNKNQLIDNKNNCNNAVKFHEFMQKLSYQTIKKQSKNNSRLPKKHYSDTFKIEDIQLDFQIKNVVLNNKLNCDSKSQSVHNLVKQTTSKEDLHVYSESLNKFQNSFQGSTNCFNSNKTFDKEDFLIKVHSSPENNSLIQSCSSSSPSSSVSQENAHLKNIFDQNISKKYNTQEKCFLKEANKVSLVTKCVNETFEKTATENFSSIPLIFQHPKEESLNLTENSCTRNQSVIYNKKDFLQNVHPSCENKNANKGSSWLQFLQNSEFSESTSDAVSPEKKLKKTFLPGGLAEQIYKLQRHEKSNRVIWNHKMNELKKKGLENAINLTLNRILQSNGFIVAKCSPENESSRDLLRNKCSQILSTKSKDSDNNLLTDGFIFKDSSQISVTSVIVLFKKSACSKFDFKIGDSCMIYPPWQMLFVPSLNAPVILCTYFIEFFQKSECIFKEESTHLRLPEFTEILPEQNIQQDVKVFTKDSLLNLSCLYGKSVSIQARVQRVWQNNMTNKKLKYIFKEEYVNFCLLLQTEDGMFLLLKINSFCLPAQYEEFILNSEGLCFKFCDITVSNCYKLKMYPYKLRMLQFMQNQVKNKKLTHKQNQLQHFLYEFTPNSYEIPKEIDDNNFPECTECEIRLLSCLKDVTKGSRFSCIAKVLLLSKDFYITDESLLNCKLKKYHYLKFNAPIKKMKHMVKKIILIKEAFVQEDGLVIDQFSNFKIISLQTNDSHLYGSRVTKISFITPNIVIPPLTVSSKEEEFVMIEGKIIGVDENESVTWLECPQCYNKNLYEDFNSVVYCEDCSCIVPNPVLHVKMIVRISSSSCSGTVKIQLLSSTTKRILQIADNDYHPQCSVLDVMGKNIGPLFCCVTDVEEKYCEKNFFLVEIST